MHLPRYLNSPRCFVAQRHQSSRNSRTLTGPDHTEQKPNPNSRNDSPHNPHTCKSFTQSSSTLPARTASDPDRLPDFLDLSDEDHDLLGYDELLDVDLDKIIAQRVQNLIDSTKASDAVETGRRLEVEIRLGQRRFANDVLINYERRCAFCGFEPTHLPKRKLLIASHIKPWSKANDRERLDTANGVAACPVHDVAFDQGLITVDNDLNIHRAVLLDASIERNPGVAKYFGSPPLLPKLLTPGAVGPGQPYVAWHREHVAGMPAA